MFAGKRGQSPCGRARCADRLNPVFDPQTQAKAAEICQEIDRLTGELRRLLHPAACESPDPTATGKADSPG
jgi:hypothetical protein